MGKTLQKIADEYKKKTREQLLRDFTKAATETNREMYSEVELMYNTFIRQFYGSYITEVYIRHGEGDPGTGMGVNLYKGKQFRMRGGHSPALILDFSGEEMESGYDTGSSADDVLMQVMNGVRFPAIKMRPAMMWHGVYHSSLTGKTYNGTMKYAFENLMKNFDDTVAPVFYKHWTSLGWPMPKK